MPATLNCGKLTRMEPYGFFPRYTQTVDYLEEANPEALFAYGLEAACIGHTEIWGNHPEPGDTNTATRRHLAVYSKQKIVQLLVEDQDMTPESAQEYAEFNVYNAYMGPNTPLFVDETYNAVPYTIQPVLPEEMYEF